MKGKYAARAMHAVTALALGALRLAKASVAHLGHLLDSSKPCTVFYVYPIALGWVLTGGGVSRRRPQTPPRSGLLASAV